MRPARPSPRTTGAEATTADGPRTFNRAPVRFQVRALHAEGLSLQQLGRLFGRTTAAIAALLNDKTNTNQAGGFPNSHRGAARNGEPPAPYLNLAASQLGNENDRGAPMGRNSRPAPGLQECA